MTYYRFTNRGPMSDWGHAMFSDNEDSVGHYGANKYTYDGLGAVDIRDLKDLFDAEWNLSAENGLLPQGYEEMGAEEIFGAFNPDDIVMSAQAWDDPELSTWFCENIAIGNDIKAVITNDGCIVFDEDLIKEA